MKINNIGNYHLPNIAQQRDKVKNKQPNKGASFSQLLKNSFNQVNDFQQEANQASRDLALGKADSIHQVMIATKKARTSLELATEVQSKVVSAYKEIMRMQV